MLTMSYCWDYFRSGDSNMTSELRVYIKWGKASPRRTQRRIFTEKKEVQRFWGRHKVRILENNVNNLHKWQPGLHGEEIRKHFQEPLLLFLHGPRFLAREAHSWLQPHTQPSGVPEDSETELSKILPNRFFSWEIIRWGTRGKLRREPSVSFYIPERRPFSTARPSHLPG